MVDKLIRIDSVEEMNYFNNRSSGENSSSQIEAGMTGLGLADQDIVIIGDVPFDSNCEFTRNDFEVDIICGKGAYAKVVKAKCIKDNIMKALKIQDRHFLIKVKFLITERKINYIRHM
jgi:hypothetical protein